MSKAPLSTVILLTSAVLTSPAQPDTLSSIQNAPDATPARDVRVVNGKQVDLAPVHVWLASPKGERPMPHWKRLQILEVKANVASYARCTVRAEDNAKTEVLIANLPPEPAAYFQSSKQQYAAIVAMRQLVAADQRALDAQVDQYLHTAPTWSSTTSGGVTTVDTPRGRAERYHHAKEKLEQDEKTLRDLELKYQEHAENNAARTAVLAMSTGQVYTKLPIWDCGRKN